MGALPPESFDRSTFEELKAVLRRLEILDEKLGQPDCVDPTKATYLEEIEARLGNS